jgi:hypothetical protein
MTEKNLEKNAAKLKSGIAFSSLQLDGRRFSTNFNDFFPVSND